MKRLMVDYTKNILHRVSFDSLLFRKELEKGIKRLLPYEVEQLMVWLKKYTTEKPELRPCYIRINK